VEIFFLFFTPIPGPRLLLLITKPSKLYNVKRGDKNSRLRHGCFSIFEVQAALYSVTVIRDFYDEN
jgi:hypothetical protein